MDTKDIRRDFHRTTKRSFFKKENIIPDETDAITQVMRITRRQRASRIISGITPDGRQYVLVSHHNNMI